MSTDQSFEPDQLLTRGECCQVFCDKMPCGSTVYYEEYYPHLYFRSYSSSGKRMICLPYAIVIGIINHIKEVVDPTDPPKEVLSRYADLDALESKTVSKIQN